MFVNHELAGVGPPLIYNRSRLEPDQLRPSAAESFIPAPDQRVRTSLESAVAALHRLNADRVADFELPNCHGPRQHRLYALGIGVEAYVRSTDALGIRGEIGK